MRRVFLSTAKCGRPEFMKGLIIILSLSITVSSCCKKEEQPPEVKREISEDIKELIYFKGNESASSVLINAQSGPDISLSTAEVDFLFDNFNTTDLLIANVHQEQTLTPDILMDNDLTLDQAVDLNAKSIETLHRVIEYFKDQDRTVYLLGASFGAFVTQELIAEKGIDVADKYLIMIGRLDINDVMWQGLAEGKEGYFMDGVTPVVDPEPSQNLLDRNLGKIAAGLGMNRYTQRLSSIQDLSNITYVYGATDQFVGRLTAEEVAFLESKNATVIRGDGGHDDTFLEFIEQGLNETFGIY